MDLVAGEEEGWEGECGVGEGDGAEVGDVDLVSDLARESEEAGEGLGEIWSVSLSDLLTVVVGKGQCDTIVRGLEA